MNSDWSGLLENSTKEAKTSRTVKGAIDLETWVKARNARGYSPLYTAKTLEVASKVSDKILEN